MITPSQFTAFITNVNTMIGDTYSTTPVIYPAFASTLPVSSSQLTLGWTGMMPKMRAWFGSRVVNEPAPQTYTVVMIPYENTYSIDRFALDDDQFGVFYRMLPDMARQAKRQPEYELRDLLEGTGVQTGTRANGFDGLTHWNTAHPIDVYDSTKGTYINDFTGGGQSVGGVTVGGALSPVAFTSLYEYMETLKGEDSERLGITPSLMMVPPTLRAEGELILKSMFFAPPAWGAFSQITGQVGSADNPLRRFGVDLLVNPLLASNSKWYLMDTTKAFKPFLWCVREAVKYVPRTQETDPIVFDRHTFLWGAWDRVAPAWSYAWLSARSGP